MKSSDFDPSALGSRRGSRYDIKRTPPRVGTSTTFFTRQTSSTKSAMRGDCYDE